MDTTVKDRNELLIELNVRWLGQALDLLARIDDCTWVSLPRELPRQQKG